MPVAPHRGAWIETVGERRGEEEAKQVAPHRGAWIETSATCS